MVKTLIPEMAHVGYLPYKTFIACFFSKVVEVIVESQTRAAKHQKGYYSEIKYWFFNS